MSKVSPQPDTTTPAESTSASTRADQLKARLPHIGQQVRDVVRQQGALIALLSISAAIVIANTIRLTVFARRREIEIMQLVGATNMYIRMPFIAEGMLAGILGAGVAIGVLALAQVEIVPRLAQTLAFVSFRVDDLPLALELLGVGAAVGLVASWISVGRHLRA